MAHVGEKNALFTIGGTRILQCLLEALRHLLLLCAVRKLENKFFRLLNGCMIDADTEPAPDSRFAVDIFPLHLQALSHWDSGNKCVETAGTLYPERFKYPDIPFGRFRRDPRQRLNVWAYVFDLHTLGIEHDKNIVYVAG